LQKSLFVDYNKMNTKSIEKFLERQIEARNRKEVDEKMQYKKAGSGQNW